MGLRMFGGSSYSVFDNKSRRPVITEKLPNPDPSNYTILMHSEGSRILPNGKIRYNLLAKIKYHDCTNYEGVKILLFRDCSYEQLKKQKIIDPHFSDNKAYHSPIIRFEPTEFGWLMGMHILEEMT